jgi:hypothetical protein
MFRAFAIVLVLAGAASAAPYKPPADVASALATFRAGFGKAPTPAEQPAVDAAQIVFKRVPLVGMAVGEARTLLGEPSAVNVIDGDPRLRYGRHNGEGVGSIHVLRVHDGVVVNVVAFPTQ